MGEFKRQTIRFDMGRAEDRQAYYLLNSISEQTGKSVSKVIIETLIQTESCKKSCVTEILTGVEKLLKEGYGGNGSEVTTKSPQKEPEIDIDWSFVGA